MSFVLQGLGLDIDSQSSVVAFGLSIDLGTATQPPTLLQLESTAIENWYAIDYRVHKRRPITLAEWRRVRRLFRVYERSRKAQEAKQRRMAAQEAQFGPLAPGPKVREINQLAA